MPTPLDNCPRVRQVVYTLFWVMSLATIAAHAVYASLGHAAPPWLGAIEAVYTSLGAPIGYMAYANTSKEN